MCVSLNCINVSEYDYNKNMVVLLETTGHFIRSISNKVYQLSVYQPSQAQCLLGIILTLNVADSIYREYTVSKNGIYMQAQFHVIYDYQMPYSSYWHFFFFFYMKYTFYFTLQEFFKRGVFDHALYCYFYIWKEFVIVTIF